MLWRQATISSMLKVHLLTSTRPWKLIPMEITWTPEQPWARYVERERVRCGAKTYARPQTAICTAATAAKHSSAVLGSIVCSCLWQCCVLLFSVSLCPGLCTAVFCCFRYHCVLLFAPLCLSKFARVSSPRSKFRSSAHTAPRVHQELLQFLKSIMYTF